jgi:hypothetical protein
LTAIMRSVADLLRLEDREAIEALTPDERVALALAIGARDLEAFRAAHSPPLESGVAARILERQRQASRRRSRCIEEIIG